jgi:acetyl-CoA carboxylase biotin carboxyl carrier protein
VITAVSVNFSELRDLLLAVNETDISELTLEDDGFKMTMRRGSLPVMVAASPVGMSPVATYEAAAHTMGTTGGPSTSLPSVDQKLFEIKSPIVGTFYRGPSPDDAPFVEIGDRIKVGQGICIVEAMKVMNEIEAEVSGEVMEILVDNFQPVEFDQVLMRVRLT